MFVIGLPNSFVNVFWGERYRDNGFVGKRVFSQTNNLPWILVPRGQYVKMGPFGVTSCLLSTFGLNEKRFLILFGITLGTCEGKCVIVTCYIDASGVSESTTMSASIATSVGIVTGPRPTLVCILLIGAFYVTTSHSIVGCGVLV